MYEQQPRMNDYNRGFSIKSQFRLSEIVGFEVQIHVKLGGKVKVYPQQAILHS